MTLTYDQFIQFAQTFVDNNCFDFSPEEITETEPGIFSYLTCYRDSSNFKSHVTIEFHQLAGELRWKVHEGWEEAYQELEDLEVELFGPTVLPGGVGEPDRDRAYRVLQTIQNSIRAAEAGEIPFSQVFNRLDLRDCLPEHTVLATTWHIDDLDDELGCLNLSPDELFGHLQAMGLDEAACRAGWECISYESQEIRDQIEEG
ncbi:hypothetical protein [Paenibacillus taichungensis]|uniref:hypothetical protein n=1 Tax=Paenibacillus taichungensis TaxID=484184 RepID=UPI0035E2A10E